MLTDYSEQTEKTQMKMKVIVMRGAECTLVIHKNTQKALACF